MKLSLTCRRNNTFRVLTWKEGGQTKVRTSSAGAQGYAGSKRGTTYAAEQVRQGVRAKREERQTQRGRELHLDLRGTGRGRRVVRKELKKKGRRLRYRTDSTQDPHNGCRRPKPRRI